MQIVSWSATMFCIALVTLISHETYGNIFRGENDRFTNVSGCFNSKAVCFDNNCTQCQCLVNQTFVQRRGKYGECISNDLVVYATSYEATFLLQHNFTRYCLYQQVSTGNNKFVLLKKTKCDDNNRNFHWLLTNFGQLLHWETLECMTDDYYTSTYYFVVLRKCDRNNQKQLWECSGLNKKDIRQTKSNRYLDYGEFDDYVTTKISWPGVAKWRRYDTRESVCSQAVGCETFVDGSSLIILNKTKCEEHSECSGEKEMDLMKRGCSILPNKTQYLHNDAWKTLEITQIMKRSFEITANKPFLKWDLSETPKSWKGLIVKVQFKCGIDPVFEATEHCVVIKYTGTLKGFDEYDDDNDKDGGDEKDGDEWDVDNKGEEEKVKIDGDNGDKINKDEESKDEGGKDNTKIIIIIVCSVALFSIAAIIGIVVYKRRLARSKSRKTRVTDQNASPVVEEQAEYSNVVNTELEPADEQSEPYVIPNKPEPYVISNNPDQHVDNGPNNNPLQSHTYEYPLLPINHHYEYPSVCKPRSSNPSKDPEENKNGKADLGVQDGDYTPLVRLPQKGSERGENEYASLINVPKDKGNVEVTDKPDRLANKKDGVYTPLVRSPSKNNKSEDSGYAPLINVQKKKENAAANKKTDK